jgi:hypothetical protein
VSIFPELPRQHHEHDGALDELQQCYPAWTIDGPAALHVYTAELRTGGGRSIHFLAGHDLDELAARLATATALDS